MSDLLGFMRDRDNKYRALGERRRATVKRRMGLNDPQNPAPAGQGPVDPVLDRSPGQPGGPATDAGLQLGSVGVSGTRTQSLVDDMLSQNRDFIKQQQDRQNDLLMQQLSKQHQDLMQPMNPLGQSNTGLQGAINAGGPASKPEGLNGRLPDEMLVDVGGGHRLQPAAAAAWQQMVAAAAQDGVNVTIGNAYRTFEAQVALVHEKGRYSQGGLAADPGTSQHGWGLAVDVASGQDWLAQHGREFGFDTIPREPWHWQYEG